MDANDRSITCPAHLEQKSTTDRHERMLEELRRQHDSHCGEKSGHVTPSDLQTLKENVAKELVEVRGGLKEMGAKYDAHDKAITDLQTDAKVRTAQLSWADRITQPIITGAVLWLLYFLANNFFTLVRTHPAVPQ